MCNLTAKTKTSIKFLTAVIIACSFVLTGVEQASAQRRSIKQSGKQGSARQIAPAALPARLDLTTGEIQTKNLEVEPQGPVIPGRVIRGVFQPSDYVEFPNLAREPNPAWSPGWIELKTGRIHSSVEAVKPREPFLHGRVAPDNRFYVYPKELKERGWDGFLPFVEQSIMEMPGLPKIIPQFLPESWTVTGEGEDSIDITAADSRAIVRVKIDYSFENDALRLAKETEKRMLRRFNAYRQLSLESAQAFGNEQGYVRRFQWRNKEIAEDIILIQVYYVENGYGFTATAGARASNFEKLKPQLQQILDNLRIKYTEQEN
jgi:hypothetical protein